MRSSRAGNGRGSAAGSRRSRSWRWPPSRSRGSSPRAASSRGTTGSTSSTRRRCPLNLDYVARPVFIHYAPGLRFGYWALEHTAPLSWGAGLAGLLTFFLGSIVLLHRICTRLFGDRRSNLLLAGLFGTSILLVTSFLWFADGLHKLPSTFFSLLAIDAYLTYRLKGSKAALALCVAAVSVGSLFYVKALLVPLYLVMIRVLFLEPRPRRALRIVWAERWTWLAFLPTIAVYLWNYQIGYSHARAPAPSLHLLGQYLWVAWFKGVTPALAGVEIGPRAAQSGVVFATICQLALIGVIGLSIRLKLSAWRAWVFWGWRSRRTRPSSDSGGSVRWASTASASSFATTRRCRGCCRWRSASRSSRGTSPAGLPRREPRRCESGSRAAGCGSGWWLRSARTPSRRR